MALNENIKNLRLELNLSLQDLSKKTGISTWSLERYENGQLNIPKINLVKIANALDVTVDSLKHPTEEETLAEEFDNIMQIASIPGNSKDTLGIINDSIIIGSDNYIVSDEDFFERYKILNNSNKTKLIEFLDVLENS